MKFCEYLHVMKPYLAPDLPEAEYLDRIFGYCLEDRGADIACEYGRVQKHYFYTGEVEPCYLAAKVLRYFDEDSFSANLYDEIEERDVPSMLDDFAKYGLVPNDEEWDLFLAKALRDILKQSRDECRSIRVRGTIQMRAALMEENPNGICPCPRCSNQLVLHADAEELFPYRLQALFLDESGPKNVSNAVGICAECMQRGDYDLDVLRQKKEEFLRKRKAYAELDDPLFPERLATAASKLKATSPDQFKPLSYKALRVKRKILPGNTVLITDIEDKVVRFFPFLFDCFSADDGTEGYSYDALSKSIRALFESADMECATQEETYETISKKIAAIVGDTESVGRVITAYFVQTCEVFNEIPE